MPKYDYKIVTLPVGSDLLEATLNKLGNEGWRLITVDFEVRRYIFVKKRYHENYKAEDQDTAH
jgi:hypothetical protein